MFDLQVRLFGKEVKSLHTLGAYLRVQSDHRLLIYYYSKLSAPTRSTMISTPLSFVTSSLVPCIQLVMSGSSVISAYCKAMLAYLSLLNRQSGMYTHSIPCALGQIDTSTCVCKRLFLCQILLRIRYITYLVIIYAVTSTYR